MEWFFLSPHFDDAAFSCGGLIYDLSCRAEPGPQPVIFTVCAGDPPPGALTPFADSLHARWGSNAEAVALRRREDERACQRLDARRLDYFLPDCIYRRLPGTGVPLIQSEEDLFKPLPDEELSVAEDLAASLSESLPAGAAVVSPLAIGGHIDHRLVRQSAVVLATRRPDIAVFYYPDFPYILKDTQDLRALTDSGWQPVTNEISQAGLAAWIAAVGEYESQISSFWKDPAEMGAVLSHYAAGGGGQLWHNPVRLTGRALP